MSFFKKISGSVSEKFKAYFPSENVTFICGFPVEKFQGNKQQEEEPSFHQLMFGKAKEKGIALMMAIMVTIVVMIYAADMIVTSAVSLEMSINNSDRIKAEFVAKSGLNLTTFMVMADWGIDLTMMDQLKQEPTDGPEDLWNFMNGMPIGADTAEMLAAVQEEMGLSAFLDSKAIDEIKGLGGSFVLNVSDESSKINVNFLIDNPSSPYVRVLLPALFSCPAEKAFLEKKELTPEELAARITDFIDKNQTASDASGFGDEDEPYLEKNPSYRAKNLPLDSINELKLVEGWDDEIHEVFSPYLTVYPFYGKKEEALLNINYVPKEMLACMFPSTQQECREKFYKEFEKIKDEGTNLTGTGGIKDVLQNLVCYDGQTTEEQKTSMDKFFTNRSSVFKIEIASNVGNQSRELKMIIRRKDPDELKKKSNKDKRAYEVLHWKLY